jgi:ferredoxin
MSCEHLVCASCAGPVVEGRCAVCRAARAEVHSHASFGLTPQAVLAIVLLAVVVVLALAQLRGA